jgi:hypothetical protein
MEAAGSSETEVNILEGTLHEASMRNGTIIMNYEEVFTDYYFPFCSRG